MVQFILPYDLDLSRFTTNFGPYRGSRWTKCHQILTQDSLGQGLLTNQKISGAV